MTRTRVGSDTARAWVRSLRLGNPYAKAILMAVANYVNDDGAAFPGLETLHADTEIAINTITARLRWCDTIGVVTISKCWIDEHGNRNKMGRGRPTSWEIRFLLDADIEAIANAAHEQSADRPLRGAALAKQEEKAAKGAEDVSQVCQSPGEGQEDREPISSPPIANHLPITGASRILESEESYPQTPFRKEAERGFENQKSDQEEKTEKRWERFRSISYPDGILDLDKARAEFGKLSEEDQEAAIIGLPAYADVLRKRRQKSKAAHLYFRQRVWRDLIGKVQESKTGATFQYPIATAAGRAVLKLARIARYTPLIINDNVVLTNAVTKQILALADAPPEDEWGGYDRGSGNFASWRDLSGTIWPGRGFAYQRIEAPWPWPPRKDGSIIATTGPPNELSDEDARALSGM